MKFYEYKKYIQADLYRYTKRQDITSFFKAIFTIPGYNYLFWLRTARFLKEAPFLAVPLYILVRFILHQLKFRYGIDIPYNTTIGYGLYIGHFGGITVNAKSIIGKNVNINQGVTIGEAFGGKFPGTPVIGNNVYIGPGAFIIGGIVIGNHVAIGANTVVKKSIPDYAVVVDSELKVISHAGSGHYIVNRI